MSEGLIIDCTQSSQWISGFRDQELQFQRDENSVLTSLTAGQVLI